MSLRPPAPRRPGSTRDGRTRRKADRGKPPPRTSQALELAPRHLPSLVNRATLAIGAGDVGQARGLLERALEVDPGHAGALNNLAMLLMDEGKDLVRVESLLRTAIEQDPDRSDARKNLAVLLASTGRLESAITELEKALKLTPEDARAWGLLAELAERSGRAELARKAREQAR